MSITLPLGFLVLQVAIFLVLPQHSAAAAHIAMVVAPLLTAAVVWRRALLEGPAARPGWALLGLTQLIWAVGAFGNLWFEVLNGRSELMFRNAMLAFNLSTVPLAFLVASDHWADGRRLVRVIDAVLALALCQAYFIYTWGMLTARGAPDAEGVMLMVWLLDVQHLLLSLGSLVRWHVAEDTTQRRLFGALSAYELAYFALMVVNNHFLALHPTHSAQLGSVVTCAFALLAWHALQRPTAENAPRQPHPTLARAVRSARPFVLAGALLIVSLFLIRLDYAYGTAGVVIAVLGYALRNTAAEVRYLARGDDMQRERSELQNIAWTDALTGVPNRHFLNQQIGALGRGPQRQQMLAVLMIDIDHFKRLNDRYGHPVGDACLREVARVLLQALVRPGDLLARYGGEEFIALLHQADAAGAQVVAERLREAVESLRFEHLDSPAGVVTVSVGVASALVSDPAGADRLLRQADKALYEAKCAGRNRVSGWQPA